MLFVLLYSHPGYFGKVGMRHFHLTRNKYYCPVINVEKLWSLVPEKVQTLAEKNQEEGKFPVLDLVRHVSRKVNEMYRIIERERDVIMSLIISIVTGRYAGRIKRLMSVFSVS